MPRPWTGRGSGRGRSGGGTWQAEMINRAYEGQQAPMGAFRFRAQRQRPSASASGAEPTGEAGRKLPVRS
jgi:hypothetical protein